MKVALHAANPRLGDVRANVATVAAAVARKEADLVVFPEMFLSGYHVGDDVQRLALRIGDPRLEPLVDACKAAKAHAIVGAPWTERAGITQNVALWVRPDGTTQTYAKRCLPTFTTFAEGQFFQAGTESPVWELEVPKRGPAAGPVRTLKLAPHICYDLFFPEHQRSQVLAGADVLLNISASPSPSRPFFETLLRARAVENASFMLYANCCGAQDNLVFWGGAQAIGPRGQTLDALPPYEEGAVIVQLDLADLVAAREFRPTIRDARAGDQRLQGHPIQPLGKGNTNGPA